MICIPLSFLTAMFVPLILPLYTIPNPPLTSTELAKKLLASLISLSVNSRTEQVERTHPMQQLLVELPSVKLYSHYQIWYQGQTHQNSDRIFGIDIWFCVLTIGQTRLLQAYQSLIIMHLHYQLTHFHNLKVS